MKALFLLFSLMVSYWIFSQEFDQLNSIQIELGGHGVLGTVNYERVILNESYLKISAQAGAPFVFPFHAIIGVWPFPVLMNAMISAGSVHLEFGYGKVLLAMHDTPVFPDSDPNWTPKIRTARIGLRYQDPGGGIVLRLGYTPLWDENDPEHQVFNIFGFSVGASF
ncbi:MAG: hypothetical protein RIE58_06110 [Vicingaceae bacterium]